MKKYLILLLPLCVLFICYCLAFQQFQVDNRLSLKGEYISDSNIYFEVLSKKRAISDLPNVKEQLIEQEKLTQIVKQYAHPISKLSWKEWLPFYFSNYPSGEIGSMFFVLSFIFSLLKLNNVRFSSS